MKKNNERKKFAITIAIPTKTINSITAFMESNGVTFLIYFLTGLSIASFYNYLLNGLGLSYNDARSHLDIGRRVVEGLKPGIAQLGSVWLPLNHALMIPTIWNDWMWHTGLSGAIQNMVSFVAIGVLIYKFLERLSVGFFGRIIGVIVFVLNLNILYLQSTAMTELLLLATMTAGCYYLLNWTKEGKLIDLIQSAFWVMLSTQVRYDGWFLLLFSAGIIFVNVLIKKGYKEAEGKLVLFTTLGGFGIALWFLWNLAIFKDPLYFAFGPFSAHAQQTQLSEAGNLQTKHDLILSTQIYLHALMYNSYGLVLVGIIGLIWLLIDKKVKPDVRLASLALTSPLFFNILALFLGFSVLFIQGLSGNTWFNVRYGIMLAPSIAIYIGYLFDRAKNFKYLILATFIFIVFFAFGNQDAVTIDDARVGSSQKNVKEVSTWLKAHTENKKGYVLISAASHDAIIFSSGLPMKKFIHEGTGLYWDSATTNPDRWARWIVMRTYDENDFTYRQIKDRNGFKRYNLVGSFPFADIYEIKDAYVDSLIVDPIFGKQK